LIPALSGTELEHKINEHEHIFKMILKRKYVAMVIFKIIMSALPSKRNELLQTLLSMIEAARQENGCRSHQVFQDIENNNVFCLIEEWETREDLENHMKSARFSVLLGARTLLNKNHDIQIYPPLQNEKGKDASYIIK
jgi:quinol monooxygenase YgiN